jgi:predicted component of type VI protein secretion system
MSESDGMIQVVGPTPRDSASSWQLRVRPPQGDERVRALSGSTLSIGRAEANDICVEDRQLSRFHARIAFENGSWAVTDLSSKNGTSVNGRAVDRAVLQHGDLLQMGDVVVVFERDESARPPAAPDDEPVGLAEQSLDALLAFGEMIACSESELAVLDEVVARMRDVVRSDRCVIYLVEEGQSKPLMQYASEDTVTSEGDDEAPDLVIERAMAADEPGMESMDGPTPRHLLLVPFHSRYRKMGVMVLERGEVFGPYHEGDLRLASIAAAHVTSFLRSVI